MSKRKKPRKLSLVKYVGKKGTAGYSNNPFHEGDVYIFIGEIANMPDHCVILGSSSGNIYSGYHTSDFQELKESEI